MLCSNVAIYQISVPNVHWKYLLICIVCSKVTLQFQLRFYIVILAHNLNKHIISQLTFISGMLSPKNLKIEMPLWHNGNVYLFKMLRNIKSDHLSFLCNTVFLNNRDHFELYLTSSLFQLRY